MYKLCDTLLNLRLITLDIGNYAVALFARFASSHAISPNQHKCLVSLSHSEDLLISTSTLFPSATLKIPLEKEFIMNFADEKFDIIWLSGQSNAQGSGYGPIEEEHLPDGVLFRMFGSGKYVNGDWVLPLPVEVGIEQSDSRKKFDFAIPFAREYMKNDLLAKGRKLLIVDTALGATGFAKGHWRPKEPACIRMHQMLDAALSMNPENRVVAILWHQGESDAARDVDEKTHYDNLSALLRSVRAKVGVVPIIAGDFCAQWKEQNAEKCAPVVRAIRRVVEDMGGAFVETADLPSNEQDKTEQPDQIHFSRRSLEILGKRYFKAFEKILKREK